MTQVPVYAFTEIVADAYHAAALAGSDMRKVTDALEEIRASATTDEYLDTWYAIDHQIGLTDEMSFQRELIALRARFADQVVARELSRLHDAFAASASDGWRDWVTCYAEALNRWRWPLVTALTVEPFAVPAALAPTFERVRGWTRLAYEGRWADAAELLSYLEAQEHLSAALRASLCVYEAQVNLYHLLLPEKAPDDLERAEALAPEEPIVQTGWAEYALHVGEYDDVRRRCEAARAADPTAGEAYSLVGQAFERENDLESAEHWYLETTKVRSGESGGYLNLLRLYGRPELLSTHEARLPGLVQRLVAVDPDSEYQTYIEVGLVYQQAGRFEEADDWYDRAVELDPARLGAYVQKGYTAIEEHRDDDATAAFEKVIEVAPEAFDGYWGLAGIHETQGRWAEALECFQASLDRQPAWRPSILGREGSVLVELGRYDEAERVLLEALRLDKDNEAATTSVLDLVATAYRDESRMPTAFRLLDELYEIKGPPYEATYRNWVGNLRYHLGEQDVAIESYERAIELRPDEAVYHSNLAGAWEQRRAPGSRALELANAIAAERRAAELDPDDPSYVTGLASLLAEETVVRVCGESALQLEWVVPPLRIDVANPLLPLILDAQGEELSAEVFAEIEAVRDRIEASCGIVVPGIRFRELGEAPGGGASYVIMVRGMPLPMETLQLGQRFCPAPLGPLAAAGIPAEVHPQALAGAWVDEAYAPAAEAAGISLRTPVQYMLAHLESVLRRRLDQFVDHRQASLLLDGTALSAEILSTPGLFTQLVQALRALVREGVPVTPLEPICTAFLELSREGLDPIRLVERLRALPEVRERLPGNRAGSTLYPFAADREEDLARAVLRRDERQPAVLPYTHDAVEAAAASVREKLPRGKDVALVVENAELRPFVRALIEPRFDRVHVVARAELPPERQVQTTEEALAT